MGPSLEFLVSAPAVPRYNDRTKPWCFAVLPAVPRRPEALNNGVGVNNARTRTSSEDKARYSSFQDRFLTPVASTVPSGAVDGMCNRRGVQPLGFVRKRIWKGNKKVQSLFG